MQFETWYMYIVNTMHYVICFWLCYIYVQSYSKVIFYLEYMWMTSLNNKFEKVLAQTFFIWLHLVSIGSAVYLFPKRPKAVENWPTTASCPAIRAEIGLASLICNAVMDVRLSAMTDRTDSPGIRAHSCYSFWQFQQLLVVYCIAERTQRTVITKITHFRPGHNSSSPTLLPLVQAIQTLGKHLLSPRAWQSHPSLNARTL